MEILEEKVEEFVKNNISGYGSGYGYGYGSGDRLKSINGQNIYYHIDDVPTIITNVHNNIAKGKILNDDFSYEDCYVAKGQGYFAHGETIKEAVNSLQEKIFDDLDPKEKIAEFRKLFKNNEKYKGEEFYKWHHILTGSCKMGRDNFIQNHNINLDDEFTVKEFIEICKNSYGGTIIKELKEFYK